MAIPSMIEDHEQRSKIRQTWMSKLPPTVRAKFYIGTSNCTAVNRKVSKEASEFGDITVVQHEDLWNNKVIKVFDAMQHATCAKFFAVVDQYSCVHVDKFLLFLLDYEAKHGSDALMYGGRMRHNNAPEANRNSIYYIPKEDLPEAVFPPYAESVGYFMSRPVVLALLSQKSERKMLPIDDVTMGTWLHRMVKEGMLDNVDYVDVGEQGIGRHNSTFMITDVNDLDGFKQCCDTKTDFTIKDL